MSVFVLISALLAAPPADSAAWTGFRNGGSSHAASDSVPLRWSPSSGIAWQRETPGYGQSTPVVWSDAVYLTLVEGSQKETCVLLALDARTGEPRWRGELPASSGLPSNYMAARAAPTPAVDSHGVYTFFEGGDVAAFSHAGKTLWKRSLVAEFGKLDNHHGLGSSLAQTDDTIFVNIEHRGPSYLLCLDKATGQTRWKADRKSSMSWSSPLVHSHAGRSVVIVSSGGTADAYDAKTGEKAWTLGEVSGNATPSPTASGPFVFLGAALSDFESSTNAARSNVCLKLTDDGRFAVQWRASRALCDYASPVVAGDCVYYINRAGVLYCLDRDTGSEHYTHRLPGPCWATPIAVGNRLYLFSKNGLTTVIETGPKWVELSQNELWDVDAPPKPEKYVEAPGGHQHGETGGQAGGGRGGFASMLQRHDKNNDGKLTADELPDEFQRFLKQGDTNQDGALDADELKAMGEAFRQRRQGMAEQSRDPIVYGVAASADALFVRTGTRLYCVRSPRETAAKD